MLTCRFLPSMIVGLLVSKLGLDALSHLSIATSHVGSMGLNHVRLQVKWCVEDHELLSLALLVLASVMGGVEVLFEGIVVLETMVAL